MSPLDRARIEYELTIKMGASAEMQRLYLVKLEAARREVR